MAYISAETCIGAKDTVCADVCPVDCIHPAKKSQLSQQARESKNKNSDEVRSSTWTHRSTLTAALAFESAR